MYKLEIISSLAILRWTVEALRKVIAMLRNPEFDSKEVDPDLHKRLEKAVHDGRIKYFNLNMREGRRWGSRSEFLDT